MNPEFELTAMDVHRLKTWIASQCINDHKLAMRLIGSDPTDFFYPDTFVELGMSDVEIIELYPSIIQWHLREIVKRVTKSGRIEQGPGVNQYNRPLELEKLSTH
jgi:hypothetical protein